jgi:hypothetical protein
MRMNMCQSRLENWERRDAGIEAHVAPMAFMDNTMEVPPHF